jgi:lipoyl synthase
MPDTPIPSSARRPGEVALKTARSGDAGGDGFFELPVVEAPGVANRPGQRPEWLRVKLPYGETFRNVSQIIEEHGLHTVCQSARCPNMGECWTAGTATFMILGDVCTRSCGFCAVKTGRPPADLDWDEPARVAEAARLMGIQHVVVTSVNRDERRDGGAPIFAETIRLLHEDGRTVEVLTPDFRGVPAAMDVVFEARPDVFSHNLESVPRLYRRVRPQASYRQSLDVLQRGKDVYDLRTKSGIMVGLGETRDEVLELLADVAAIGLDVMTIGQYLQPTRMHLPVEEFVHPDVFHWYKEQGEAMGIGHVESGPLVRSSYHAERHI